MKTLVAWGIKPRIALVSLSNFLDDEFGINRVHIHTVQALVKGGGREALKTMCRNAADVGITLSLNACAFRTDVYPEPWDVNKLVSWYHTFGFVSVVPKSDFYADMKHLMVKYG